MSNYNAYQKSANSIENPREIEYRLLGQVTSALIEAENPATEQQTRIDALLWNRSVWSAFRVDLMDPSNRLPTELRASLVSLSIFVEKETVVAIDGSIDLSALIEINKSIMDGLRPSANYQSTSDDAQSQGVNQIG
jgi:flagellar protein FlaF